MSTVAVLFFLIAGIGGVLLTAAGFGVWWFIARWRYKRQARRRRPVIYDGVYDIDEVNG